MSTSLDFTAITRYGYTIDTRGALMVITHGVYRVVARCATWKDVSRALAIDYRQHMTPVMPYVSPVDRAATQFSRLTGKTFDESRAIIAAITGVA